VSHDRFFLDSVVTRIADLTLRTLTDYHTNYSGYLAEHHERIEAMRKAKREQDEEIARVKMFIDRFRYQATKAAQVQSRIKQLEKVGRARSAARAQEDQLQLSALREKRAHGHRAASTRARPTTA
jgi:ATP-binding cassette subfamily F protein 3